MYEVATAPQTNVAEGGPLAAYTQRTNKSTARASTSNNIGRVMSEKKPNRHSMRGNGASETPAYLKDDKKGGRAGSMGSGVTGMIADEPVEYGRLYSKQDAVYSLLFQNQLLKQTPQNRYFFIMKTFLQHWLYKKSESRKLVESEVLEHFMKDHDFNLQVV